MRFIARARETEKYLKSSNNQFSFFQWGIAPDKMFRLAATATVPLAFDTGGNGVFKIGVSCAAGNRWYILAKIATVFGSVDGTPVSINQ